MFTKTIVFSSILMSVAAISATANAGSTITDKSYWPGEIHQQRQSAVVSAGNPSASFAYDDRPIEASPKARVGVWTYNGGPKGR
jgi:hypothetical protein